eukprot:XP_011662113.1 PREDICTED: uncharacterized protein LOC577135 isoform X2 [Strongylocentrotus purpuratus]
MESHDLTGVGEHQFSLDSFTSDAEHHVGKFGSSGTSSLMGNVTVSVPDGVIDTTGLVASFSNAHHPIATDSPQTIVAQSSSIGHVTLSDISSNLRRISSGPGGLLTGTVISPESLRAVTNIFQTLPDTLSQQRVLASLSSGQAVIIGESMNREIQEDGDGLSIGINLVAGSLGALSEKEVGRTSSLSDQSPLGMGILQVPDNTLSAMTSRTNVVFTTSTNTTSLVGNAELGPGDDHGEAISIGDTLQADVNDAVTSSSLLEPDSQMMVGGVEGVEVESNEGAGRQIPVTCQIPTHELARLVQTVEQASGNVGELESSADSVNLINVAGVPSVEFSSTGQLVIRQGYVVCTQDGENLVAMTQAEDVALATSDEQVEPVTVNMASATSSAGSQSLATEKSPLVATEKKKGKGGWPKGKKRKKDILEMAKAPRPPSSAYAMFLAEQREGYRESHPEVVGRKVSSLLGKMWTGLPPDVKKRYLDMEKKDKERYIKEIKEYQESSSCQAFLKKQTENAVRNFCGSEEAMSEQIVNMSKNDILGCNYLQCKVCDMYFHSTHNMSQHVLGKQHMTALAAKICEMDQETLGLKELEEGVTQPDIASTSDDCRSCECFREGMPHTEGFRSTFMDLHFERELELRELRRHHAISIHEQMTLRRKCKILQETMQKAENDHRNLKAIGSNIQSKLDGLYRMILFLT